MRDILPILSRPNIHSYINGNGRSEMTIMGERVRERESNVTVT